MPKAISLRNIFDQVGYAPHPTQVRIHKAAAKARFRVACAGRRTGKSTVGGHELTAKAVEAYYRQHELDPTGTRMEYWIVGPEYTDAEKEFRVLYNDLTKLEIEFDRPGTYYDVNGGNMHISLYGGRFLVHAKSAKYPASLVGEGLDGVIFAEAAKLKPSIWHKYLRPTLADKRGFALMTSTPEGKNWFYEMWQRGQANKNNWWSIRMPSWSNPFLFPEGRNDPEILDMSDGMTEEKFKQEIGAEFTEFVGQVFKDWDEEYHVTDVQYDPNLPVDIATDYGFTNPNVALFIQTDTWDNVRVIGEYYRRNRRDEEFASDVLEDPKLGPLARKARHLYPDPEDPGATATLSQKWQVSAQSGTGGLLRDRLDLIRRWIKLDHQFTKEGMPVRAPKLQVDRSCLNLIREMSDYRYPDKTTDTRNDQENPLKKDDHTPEALGRFMAGRFAIKQEKHKTRVRRARVRSA